MTGPEHFKKAEQLVRRAADYDLESAKVTYAEAQVHATLALAAATALGAQGIGEMSVPDAEAWVAAAATPSPSDESAAAPKCGDGRG